MNVNGAPTSHTPGRISTITSAHLKRRGGSVRAFRSRGTLKAETVSRGWAAGDAVDHVPSIAGALRVIGPKRTGGKHGGDNAGAAASSVSDASA